MGHHHGHHQDHGDNLGLAAWRLRGGESLNAGVINWHLLEDVLGWLAVLVVALVLLFFDWPILAALLSIGFTLFILFKGGKALAETLGLFLQETPRDMELPGAACRINARTERDID